MYMVDIAGYSGAAHRRSTKINKVQIPFMCLLMSASNDGDQANSPIFKMPNTTVLSRAPSMADSGPRF